MPEPLASTRVPRCLQPVALSAGILLALLAVVPSAAGAEPDLAEDLAQLVHFNNGRTLRAETVEEDGRWLLLTLEGGNVLGVLNDNVESVEDDLIALPGELGSTLNVVTSGRYIPPSSGPRGRSGRPPVAPRPPSPSQSSKSEDESRKAEQQGGAVVGGAQQPGVVFPGTPPEGQTASPAGSLRQRGLRRNVARPNAGPSGDQ